MVEDFNYITHVYKEGVRSEVMWVWHQRWLSAIERKVHRVLFESFWQLQGFFFFKNYLFTFYFSHLFTQVLITTLLSIFNLFDSYTAKLEMGTDFFGVRMLQSSLPAKVNNITR